MSSVIGELRVSGSGAVLTEDAFPAVPEAEVRLQYQASSEKAGIIVSGCDFNEFEKEVESDPSIDECERVADFSDVRVYNITASPGPTLISELLAQRGIQILDAASPAGSTEWHLRVRSPNRSNLSDFTGACRGTDISVRLETLYSEALPPDSTYFRCPAMKQLTEGQYDALEEAYRMGYFNVPRDIRLEQLSQELGISSQAMSERLRRGLNTLVESHLQGDVTETTS